MARPSYGPEAKKRSHRLLTLLLDFASGELDCDETALDTLRPHIQVHWQSEQRLIVRTKVRFLEALSKVTAEPLTGEHIKEALKRFEDFLEILEDNRPHRGGSETWHFTLKLWHPQRDRTANLRRLEQEWEQRRPQKSKQVTQQILERETGLTDLKTSDELTREDLWWQWCRNSLETQQCQRLTTNPLTIGDGVTFELDEVYVPLGVVERQQAERRDTDVTPDQGSQLYESEEVDNDPLVAVEAFLAQLQQPGLTKRIAIVGEPGAGKTTLLQKIASDLLNRRVLPIWISLADLQGATLEQYLLNDWLKAATRKVTVSPELQVALAEQFNQGRVWLLLDAVDEMATEATLALANIARQLRGWIADAHIILTCRLNVWDGGKNALEAFTTYRSSSFSYRDAASSNQIAEFINRWFHRQPGLGKDLCTELDKPERKRIRDTVKNPLRLALLCRAWSLSQGTLPNSKAALYQQFVETIYAWKQDRFPTGLTERYQLNQALGQLALSALAQPNTKFRLPQSLVHQVFRERSLDLLDLALHLGWLNQVGISAASGEKVYAFYHPTFQEYFAAQAIADWHFFFEPAIESAASPPIFASQWREVILLWLGRTDITPTAKVAFLRALIDFKDECGGFYDYQAYFLAAAGLAEFPEYAQTEAVITQLLNWRFGEMHELQQTWHYYPSPIQEGARVALLQTDRTRAIASLEKFIQSTPNFFACYNAAYSLGKTFDPGNFVAVSTITRFLETLHSEPLRLDLSEKLSKLVPSHPLAIATLVDLIRSTERDSLRRKAAYALGKLDSANAIATDTLTQLIETAADPSVRLQAAQNLLQLDPNNSVAAIAIEAHRKPPRFAKQRQAKPQAQRDPAKAIAQLEQRLATVTHAATQRRLACELGRIQPGHPQAIAVMLELLRSPHSTTLYRRIGEDLKQILLTEQLNQVVSTLKGYSIGTAQMVDRSRSQKHSSQSQECYKLLWHCAQQLPYPAFRHAWN